jgi:hypothetical protein
MVDEALLAMVTDLKYKPGWFIWLARPSLATLWLGIRFETSDSQYPEEIWPGLHYFDVPPSPPEGGWQRWLIDRIMDVERHEAMEFFQIGEQRPFYPDHNGPASECFEIRERRPYASAFQ